MKNPLSLVGGFCRSCISALRFRKDPETVIVYAYPKFLFTLPIMLMGYLLWAPATYGWISPVMCGWWWILAFTLCIVAVGFELSRNEAIFMIVTILLIWVFGLWLKDAKHIFILSTIFGKFFGMKPSYMADFGLVVSIIMSVLGAIMFVSTRLNDRWVLSANSAEHFSFGRRDEALTFGAKGLRFDYADAMELVLGFAGSIVIMTPDSRFVQRRIDNVPGLKLLEKKINSLRSRVAVSATPDLAETVTDQSTDHHDGDGTGLLQEA